MLQKSGRLVLWEAMFILELHSAETQEFVFLVYNAESISHQNIVDTTSMLFQKRSGN